MRLVRAGVIVLLLTGGLFPPVGGIPLNLLTALVAIPLVIHEIARTLPIVHPLIPFVAFLFGTFAVSVLITGPSNDYGIEKATTFFTLTLLGTLVAALVRDKGDLRTLAKTWAFVATGLAVFALVGFTGGDRASGFASSPIWLGRAFATGGLAAMWLAWQSPKQRKLYALLSVFLLVGIVATGSRGPLIGFALGALALALAHGRFSLRRVAGLGAAAALGIVAIQALPIFQNSRLLSSASDTSQSSSLRETFWSATIKIIHERPGGVGIGNWAEVAIPPAGFMYPHNLFLEIASESGAAIAALFMVAVICLVASTARRSRSDPQSVLVLSLILCELVSVSVSGDLNGRTFFFFLGLAVVVRSARWGNETAPRPTRNVGRGKVLFYDMA